jgi:hypothetical protein
LLLSFKSAYFCPIKKLAFISLLIFSLLLTTGAHLVVYWAFLANQDFLITEMCESREEAESMCAASCQLSLQMQQVNGATDEKAPHSKRSHSQEENLMKYWISPINLSQNIVIEQDLSFLPHENRAICTGFPDSLLEPPRA